MVLKEESTRKARIHSLNYLVQWQLKDKVAPKVISKPKIDEDGEPTVGWKFNKTRQVWLLKHMYMLESVPPKYFRVLLQYLQTI